MQLDLSQGLDEDFHLQFKSTANYNQMWLWYFLLELWSNSLGADLNTDKRQRYTCGSDTENLRISKHRRKDPLLAQSSLFYWLYWSYSNEYHLV